MGRPAEIGAGEVFVHATAAVHKQYDVRTCAGLLNPLLAQIGFCDAQGQ